MNSAELALIVAARGRRQRRHHHRVAAAAAALRARPSQRTLVAPQVDAAGRRHRRHRRDHRRRRRRRSRSGRSRHSIQARSGWFWRRRRSSPSSAPVDDVRTIEVAPRLLLQALAVGIVIASLPAELRVVPMLPWWVERALLLLACLWFVNLTNFMDGIDWMTVAEFVPITIGLVAHRMARRAADARRSSWRWRCAAG